MYFFAHDCISINLALSIFPCEKAKAIGLTEVDRKLLRMQKKAQEVIITAAIRSNYPIVKILHSDGYKVI